MGAAPSFSQWLKQRRQALGLTQKALAQPACCAEVTLRKIEAGDLHPSAPLAETLGRIEVTARLLGAIDTVDQVVHRLLPIEHDDRNRLADAARAHLGAAAFDAAWSQGRGSAFEAAAVEAVSILEAALSLQDQAVPAGNTPGNHD